MKGRARANQNFERACPALSKFADDTKIGTSNSVFTHEDRQRLQEDLHKISAWSNSKRWEMPFDVDKCQVLQVGTRYKKFDYEIHDVKLKSAQFATDLDVKIASDFNLSQQCCAANKYFTKKTKMQHFHSTIVRSDSPWNMWYSFGLFNTLGTLLK